MAEAKRLEEVIGENIRRLREGSELSQTELGLEVGNLLGNNWSAQTVSQAEKGKRAFVAAEMVALARIFHCSIPDLYRRRDVGNVIVSDIFVMSRTELLAQTMAVETSEISRMIFSAVDTLDEAHGGTLRALEDLREAEKRQQLAIDLLAHAGRTEVVKETPNA